MKEGHRFRDEAGNADRTCAEARPTSQRGSIRARPGQPKPTSNVRRWAGSTPYQRYQIAHADSLFPEVTGVHLQRGGEGNACLVVAAPLWIGARTRLHVHDAS